MSLLPLATVGEVVTLFGPLTPDQQTTVADLLVRASAMLRSRSPRLDARIAAGDLDAGLASTAVIGMVLRVINNPKGSRSETVGPFSRSWDTSVMSGLLQLLPGDLDLVAASGTGAGATGGAGTIMTRAGLAAHPPAGVVRVRGW
jgi:hypothetical protein